MVDVGVEAVVAADDGFTLTTYAWTSHHARRIVVATGLRDVLPDVPGMSELWGPVVAHCPFCHGPELTDGAVAIQGGPHTTKLAAMLSRIAGEMVVLANGYEFADPELDQLGRIGAEVRSGRIEALHAEGDGALAGPDGGLREHAGGNRRRCGT